MESKGNLEVGQILGECAGLVSEGARAVAVFVAVVGGVTAIGMALGLTETVAAAIGAGLDAKASEPPMAPGFDFLVSVVSIVASYMLIKSLVVMRRPSADLGNRFWHYLGMSILSVIGIIFGLVLLIVPGIFLLVRWSAASGFAIAEDRGVIEALGASWDATKGSGWTIFGAALVLLIILAIAGGVFGAVFGVLSMTVLGYLSAFIEAASSAVFTAFGAAVYLLLTNSNEAVAEVFS